jgi:Gpi18-like mannosyltransferase
MPYLYFLFGVSRIEIYDLYQIKIFSVFFDLVLALGSMKIVSLFSKSDVAKLLTFAATLFVPTVFLNSAFWGQCDGIYAALCIWGLYFGLKSKGIPSVIFFALAFSFKIQSIFILPIIIFLILSDKIKLKELLLFPITFFITLLPALICGRSFYDTFSIYINQTESYPSLTLNCPTLWAFFPEESFNIFGTAALFLAGAAVLLFCTYLYYNRAKLDAPLLFDAAYLFALLIPFLLPRMHERYFYLAEALSVAYMLLHRNRAFIPPLLLFTTFDCYCAYLFSYRFFELWELSIVNAVVIFYLFYKFIGDVEAKLPVYLPERNEARKI